MLRPCRVASPALAWHAVPVNATDARGRHKHSLSREVGSEGVPLGYPTCSRISFAFHSATFRPAFLAQRSAAFIRRISFIRCTLFRTTCVNKSEEA